MATQSRFSVRPKVAARAVASSEAAAISARIASSSGLAAEIGLHEPRPAAAGPRILGLEHGRRGLGRLEALNDEVGDRAGAALVADEAHHVGGVVGRQAFEHAEPNTPTHSNGEPRNCRPRAGSPSRLLRRIAP